MTNGGNPNGATDERYQPEKVCPICGKETKGLPYHIARDH